MDFEWLTSRINVPRERIDAVVRIGVRATVVIALGYMAASAANGYIMQSLMGSALSAFTRISRKDINAASVSLGVTDNYRDIEKAIRDRNLFNATGEFPDESQATTSGQEAPKSSFDINAPCTKPSQNLALMGTIYMNVSSESLATIRDADYSEADIYREGDLVIGNESTSIVRIERNRVILNNNGKKECLELSAGVKGPASDGFPAVSPGNSDRSMGGGEAPPASGGDCALEEKYVQDELGPGFATIIQKARLVPNTTDNQMNGFKIFAIDQASLLARVGLQNGDIITQVNDTSLKQPEQGFTLYQAFQDEREVRINILRRGTTPMMITCRIK